MDTQQSFADRFKANGYIKVGQTGLRFEANGYSKAFVDRFKANGYIKVLLKFCCSKKQKCVSLIC